MSPLFLTMRPFLIAALRLAASGQELVTRGQCHILVMASKIAASPSAA